MCERQMTEMRDWERLRDREIERDEEKHRERQRGGKGGQEVDQQSKETPGKHGATKLETEKKWSRFSC